MIITGYDLMTNCDLEWMLSIEDNSKGEIG